MEPRSLYTGGYFEDILVRFDPDAFRTLNGLEMVNDSLKRKRWWPRFGLRTLLAILLVCAIYFALGQPTKTLGVRDVSFEIGQSATAQYKAPLLLEYPVASVEFSRQSGRQIGHITEKRSYYFWFFGAVAKLPFTSETMRDFVPRRQVPTTTGVPDASGVLRPPTAMSSKP